MTKAQTKLRKDQTRALAAFRRMMGLRGHVVCGFVPGSDIPDIGEIIWSFAGVPLSKGASLIVEGRTDRKDWQDQLEALFGNRFKALAKAGERFMECSLLEDTDARQTEQRIA
jgi:hypothetical protein